MSSDTFFIKFFAPITAESVAALMQVVDDRLRRGARNLRLLLSTPGGDVFQGISAHNYLRGVPLRITTHNFGSCDSIGTVLFCAGQERLTVPHARFFLQSVQLNFTHPCSLDEAQLEGRLRGLRMDMDNIARVISDATGKEHEEVLADMTGQTTLSSEEAQEYGLIHRIEPELISPGADIVSIQMAAQPIPGPQVVAPAAQPTVQSQAVN